MLKPVLVIKIGSAVITSDTGGTNTAVISKLSSEVAALSETYRVVLVSSGAVGSGKAYIRQYRGTLTERKAAAAIGNPLLIQLYHRYFRRHGLTVAQALCERHHFSNRPQFLQLKDTFAAFWENGVVPIVNENDLVSNVELKFSDNDELATLLAIGFDADTLLICTSVGGLMDDNKKILSRVEQVDAQVLGYVRSGTSSLGLGGMLSKLTFTKLATSLGIRVIISGLSGREPLRAALAGEKGITFRAGRSNLKARQKWLASGSITLGGIQIDRGAEKALANRKSLLSVGIRDVQGNFTAGEVVQLINEDNVIIGVAKARLDAGHLRNNIAEKNTLAAHADNIVIF